MPKGWTITKIELEDLIKLTDKFKSDIFVTLERNGKVLNVYLDTKNYTLVSGMFKGLKQLKAYFSKIDNFSQLLIKQKFRIVKGIEPKEMLTAFKKALAGNKKSCEAVFKANETLWKNIEIESADDLLQFCAGNKANANAKLEKALEKIFKTTK